MSEEATGFLYPFIEADERNPSALLVALARSAQDKMHESATLRHTTLTENADALQQIARSMAGRFSAGGRLFLFGNGGSATDAEGAADLFRDPPWGHPLPALSLVDDRAVLTALANDVGFELVFSRQLIALARPGDMAIGFSTSGDSINVLHAFAEASRRGVLTIALCGYDGGAMLGAAGVDHCLVVRSESVHRIQETQDALTLYLWSVIQEYSVIQQHSVTQQHSVLQRQPDAERTP